MMLKQRGMLSVFQILFFGMFHENDGIHEKPSLHIMMMMMIMEYALGSIWVCPYAPMTMLICSYGYALWSIWVCSVEYMRIVRGAYAHSRRSV